MTFTDVSYAYFLPSVTPSQMTPGYRADEVECTVDNVMTTEVKTLFLHHSVSLY